VIVPRADEQRGDRELLEGEPVGARFSSTALRRRLDRAEDALTTMVRTAYLGVAPVFQKFQAASRGRGLSRWRVIQKKVSTWFVRTSPTGEDERDA
jgi:hypothetical protein